MSDLLEGKAPAPRSLVSAKEAEVLAEYTALKPVTDEEKMSARDAVPGALTCRMRREDVIVGSALFFRHAEQQLLASTRLGLELSGAVFASRIADGICLQGLSCKMSGAPGLVAIDASWGKILWHTHPGMKASLAAFSNEDLEATKACKRPLLVIGFGGLSPDVVSTLALPLGLKGFLLSGAVKGLLSFEKRNLLPKMLLRMGVAARVCFPDGTIRQVVREHASPLVFALDDVSFLIDQSVGTIERVGQRALKKAYKVVASPFQ
ncbi:MAG: hypothetical protein GY822_00230 [Deltaproteobacteria bacterium]|nr:hypothetical protein [Deltaproteobacteria bacterium]